MKVLPVRDAGPAERFPLPSATGPAEVEKKKSLRKGALG
jgi:hypothetical protein